MKKLDNFSIEKSGTHGNHWADSHGFRIFVAVIIGLGIYFRMAGLGNKIYSHDEAYASLRAAGYNSGEVFTTIWNGEDKTAENIRKYLKPGEEKNLVDTLSVTALNGPHQAPLFYLLAHIWMRLVGYTPIRMRALAAIIGIACIPAMYWMSRELFKSSHTATLSTVFFAISPFQILYAQDARPYSLWTLITLLSSASLLHAMHKNNKSAWLTYTFTLILGIYSHQLFILVASVHGMYYLGIHFLLHKKVRSVFFGAFIIAFLAYIPWLFFLTTRWQRVSAQMDWLNYQPPLYRYLQRWVLIFGSPFIDLDLGSLNIISYVLRALVLIVVATALLFLVKNGSLQQKIFLTLTYIITAGALIVPDILFGGIRSINGRYFVPANIGTILIIAFFIKRKFDQGPSYIITKWKFISTALIAVSLISNINSLLAETWWNKELGRITPEFVHKINKDGTLLVVSGFSPTNLGDILSLSLMIDQNVDFRLIRDPDEIKFSDNHEHIYWLPGSYKEFLEVSQNRGIHTTEILQDTLWLINE